MVFDGRNYAEPVIISPYHYHPKAPATAITLREAMRSGYIFGRHHSRLLFTQSYHRNLTSFTNFHLNANTSGAEFERIAQARAFIPEHATHLVAYVQGQAMAWRGSTTPQAYVRVSVTDDGQGDDSAGTGDSGSTYVAQVEEIAAQDYGIHRYVNDFIVDHNADAEVDGYCEVEVRDFSAGAIGFVFVEGYASSIGSSDNYLMPEFVTVWWEARD